MGTSNKFYNIIKDMYSKSKSCVRIDNCLTDFFKINMGVRQGDNLSPNLFKIFINDLPEYLEQTQDPVILDSQKINCLMYADDVILLSSSADGLQSKLDKLNVYCKDWCLDINVKKTKIIVFNKSGKQFNYLFKFHNKILECVPHYKYLGLHFSSSGSFSYAKSELYKKGLRAYYKLCKGILHLQPSVKTCLHVFDHTVVPILLYGSEIWGSFDPKKKRNLEMGSI